MTVPLKSCLASVFKHEAWKLTLFSEWQTIVGDLALHMRIEKVYQDTLIIGVYQTTWLQELYLLSSVLILSINKALEKEYIKTLKFVLVQQKIAASPVTLPTKKKTIHERPLIHLTEKEATILYKIKDEELQQALHKLLSNCYYQKLDAL